MYRPIKSWQIKTIYLMATAFIMMGLMNSVISRYHLVQDGIEDDATILEYIGNKGSTLYGKVIPMHKHLVEIQGEKHVLILQNQYTPGKIKLRWVPDRHINDAVVLTDTGTYTILDVLGGPPRIVAFILQAGVLMLFLGGLTSLFAHPQKN